MSDESKSLKRLQAELEQTRTELGKSHEEVTRLTGKVEKSQASAFEERQLAQAERSRLIALVDTSGTVAGQARKEAEEDRAQLRGEVAQFKSVVTDQLKQMTQQKLRSERFVETVPVGIAYLDNRLYYRWANPAFTRLMNRPPEEVIGHPLLEVFPQARDRLVDLLNEVFRTGKPDTTKEPVTISFTTEVKGGLKTANWDVLALPMVGEHEQIEGVLVAIEVTGRMERDRRQQAQIAALTRTGQRKNETLETASEKMRTGLKSISESARAMAASLDGLTEAQRRNIAMIQGADGQLTRIADDLLELARIEVGSYELQYEEADVSALVRENIGRLAEVASKANVQPVVKLSDEPLIVKADRRRLDRVLQTLLGNAIRSTTPGGRLAVTVTAGEQEATVEVADSGKGIDAKELGRMFDQFSELNLSKPDEFERAAKGLAISKTLIELHGGTLSAKSEKGKGSTFWFKLPLAKQVVKPESSPGLKVSMMETSQAEKAAEERARGKKC